MIEDLIRPYILKLAPYSTARDDSQGVGRIFLDANENPHPSSVNRYPDPHQRAVKERLSQLLGIKSTQIFLGNGSDEAIDLLIRVAVAPNEAIVVMPPTYGMYKVAAAAHDVRVVEAPLRQDFTPDVDAVGQTGREGAKVLFVCSPNNPTGNHISLQVISDLIGAFPGIVVVDEAYIDFSSEASALSLLNSCDRLVILRTLSKAWGLAGVRMGMAIGHPNLIAALSKVKLPYNINALTQDFVLKALEGGTRINFQIQELISERVRVSDALRRIAEVIVVYPSDANFILVKVTRPQFVFAELIRAGIVVRDRSKEHLCSGCLRITIGTKEENNEMLQVFEDLS
jgi:histidinol-phosphate aminotransferase